jgi:hypothetical protein
VFSSSSQIWAKTRLAMGDGSLDRPLINSSPMELVKFLESNAIHAPGRSMFTECWNNFSTCWLSVPAIPTRAACTIARRAAAVLTHMLEIIRRCVARNHMHVLHALAPKVCDYNHTLAIVAARAFRVPPTGTCTRRLCHTEQPGVLTRWIMRSWHPTLWEESRPGWCDPTPCRSAEGHTDQQEQCLTGTTWPELMRSPAHPALHVTQPCM